MILFKHFRHFHPQGPAVTVSSSWAVVSTQKSLPFPSFRLKKGKLGQSRLCVGRWSAAIGVPSPTVIKFTQRAPTSKLTWGSTRERDRTPARGRTAATPFRGRTSWRGTRENTPELGLSSVKFAPRALQGPTIWLCTQKDIEPECIAETKYCVIVLSVFKIQYILYSIYHTIMLKAFRTPSELWALS